MKAILLAPREPGLEPLTCTRPPAMLPVLAKPCILPRLQHLADFATSAMVIGETANDLSDVLQCAAPGIPLETVSEVNTGPQVVQALRDCPDGFMLFQAHDVLDEADLVHLAAHGGTIVQSDATAGGLCADADSQRVLAICELAQPALEGIEDSTPLDLLLQSLSNPTWPAYPLKSATSRPIIHPWHIIEANVDALKNLHRQHIEGEVHEGVRIDGPVEIGAGSVIKNGTTIEGPVVIGENCTIGPCAYIRPDTVIGNDCFIGHGFEIFDSVVFDGTKGKHRSYVGHSVIGADVNIGCGFITSDYRHDSQSHVTLIHDKKLDSGRTKLGAFLGDGVKTGIQTLVYPGRKIWPGLGTLPGEIVREDKHE